MALSDAAILEELKTARDAIVSAIADGSATVEYEIRGRRVRREASSTVLRQLEESIKIYETKTSLATRSRFRLGTLARAK